MNFLIYSERLNHILELVLNDNLRSPKHLSKKFECSEKTARRMINRLREKGYTIEYCRRNQKYFLKE